EIDEMRIDEQVVRGTKDQPDHSGFAGGEPLGAAIGFVVELLGDLEHPRSRLLADFRDAVARTADGRRAEAQMARKLAQWRQSCLPAGLIQTGLNIARAFPPCNPCTSALPAMKPV